MNDQHFGTKFVYINLKNMWKILVNPFAQFLFSSSIYGLNNNNFVCVEVLQPSQPNGVMLSVVSLPNHKFTGQA